VSDKLRLLSLFAGIGGFELGLERSGGFQTVAQCEIDPYCNKVLAKHWPEVKRYGDIRELTADRLATDGIAVDAICGGFPCQDISNAGKQAGIEGERSGLWSEYARLIGELRPRVVFVENVAALLNRGLDRVLGDLAALGYDAVWDCIPASAVGAPHQRDRIWLVAYPERGAFDQQHQSAVFGRRPHQAKQTGLGGCNVAHSDNVLHQRELVDREGSREAGGSQGGDLGQGQTPNGQRVRTAFGARGQDVADAFSTRLERQPRRLDVERNEPGRHPSQSDGSASPQGLCSGGDRSEWWSTEPDVGRVAHGVPARAHRLRALGNAVVPQIPELLGRAYLQAMETTHV
jgi:DNA (cytosine-5)-methyltransferase 1